ncbi:hypothetical protein PUN28_010913 [Cardiocondyla obscurior]|uniref:Tryptophan 5-hydroxylase 2 n=1 Tax=Cardiocondyla obscurior TaxID=286306 RepID=A0AAW2FIQ3_9HYME
MRRPARSSLKRTSADAETEIPEIENHPSENNDNKNSVIFSLKNQVGGLARALQVFQDLGINVVHIESRKSLRRGSEYDILVDVECDSKRMEQLIKMLSREVAAINLSHYEQIGSIPRAPSLSTATSFALILIPRKTISGMQKCKKRKKKLICMKPIYIKHIIFLFCLREDNIPQLQDINVFLKRTTGFQLRPVAGYLTPRDFLAGLAFRVFHCTQYIRHSSDPFYTPEPDCCHELLGHMPLLANPSFAQFSQELGLASLGASDEDIDKLATLYFFTVEFGLCKQDGILRVYGAGLLSSVAELRHAVTTPEKTMRFEPDVTCKQECIITAFQNAYYYTDSIEEAKEKMRAFANQIQRPFGIRYNPYTQSVEVLTDAQKISAVVSELRGDLCIVSNALKKIHEQDDTVDVERITSLLTHGIEMPQDSSSDSDDQDNSPNAEETRSPKDQQSRNDDAIMKN